MKLTNKFGLPQTFVNVIQRPTYTKGKANISVTELLNSPRIVQLKRKHWDEIETDASEMVWALFGSAVHNILEHGKDDHHIVEERIFAEHEGWKLSGAIDLQEVEEDGIIISDYKVTGAWSVMNEKQDWHNQLNIYAWLVEKVKQQPVKKLQIIAIVRDWSARDTAKEGYPSSPIATIDIPLWPMDQREEYINKRIHLHSAAYFDSETDGDIAQCTPDEMWEKPEKFAVKKEGGARAKSLHDSRDEAEIALPPKGYFIEHRPGSRTRCESYCQVSAFCSQYQTYLKEKP
jgi:hypothetical protein